MSGTVQSFPYSADSRARILILGSMPGAESLRQQQYYAHPHNLFWALMEDLFDAKRELPYAERLATLRKHHIALWDVAHTCRREGSLDANITNVKANDFSSLFKTAPHIHTVFFNGQKAEALFRKLALPSLKRDLRLITLPSTSPANASIPPNQKKAAWNQIRTALAQ